MTDTYLPSATSTIANDATATARATDTARKLKGGAASKDPAQMRKAAQEFEAMFLSQMFGHVFEGLERMPLALQSLFTGANRGIVACRVAPDP